MRIDPGNLLIFLGVSEAGGFNRASAVIHKSQPAITRTIHQLESAIGTELFTRSSGGVELTPAGELLLGHARAIRRELVSAEEGLLRTREGNKVTVKVGTVAVHPLDMFAKVLADVSANNQNINLSVAVGSESDMMEQLRNGELSFVVLPMPQSASSTAMTCIPIFLDEAAIYCQPDHPITKITDPTVYDLQAATWTLGPSGTLLRHRLDMVFLAAGIGPPKIALEVEDVRLRRALMTECAHLSIFAKHHVAHLVQAGKLVQVPFELTQDRRPIVALQLGSGADKKLMTEFVDRLHHYYEGSDLTLLPHRASR